MAEDLRRRGYYEIHIRDGPNGHDLGWSTDSEPPESDGRLGDVDRRRTYVARVYDAPADSLELSRVQLLAEAQSDDHVEATRLALEGAEESRNLSGGDA